MLIVDVRITLWVFSGDKYGMYDEHYQGRMALWPRSAIFFGIKRDAYLMTSDEYHIRWQVGSVWNLQFHPLESETLQKRGKKVNYDMILLGHGTVLLLICAWEHFHSYFKRFSLRLLSHIMYFCAWLTLVHHNGKELPSSSFVSEGNGQPPFHLLARNLDCTVPSTLQLCQDVCAW